MGLYCRNCVRFSCHICGLNRAVLPVLFECCCIVGSSREPYKAPRLAEDATLSYNESDSFAYL